MRNAVHRPEYLQYNKLSRKGKKQKKAYDAHDLLVYGSVMGWLLVVLNGHTCMAGSKPTGLCNLCSGTCQALVALRRNYLLSYDWDQ
ncbi:hypothetical protein Taro_035181 [Colocasia esculenta]|uniref:Uncharacterized protein n=1 Tax=Colocasia esculenta TaxID=4460 RepID=A0A843VTL5_COLES|nr:hypothetical protein [Colocasia esculenta]